MFISIEKPLTELERVFLEPTDPTHRQYEALRAYCVEGLPSQEVAKRFGYTRGSFRVLCHHSANTPNAPAFSNHTKVLTVLRNGIRSVTRSLRCGSKTSPSTISARPSRLRDTA